MSEIICTTPSGGVFKIKPAEGEVTSERTKKIAIGFPVAVFDAIAAEAQVGGRTFSAQVRYYVELGRRVAGE